MGQPGYARGDEATSRRSRNPRTPTSRSTTHTARLRRPPHRVARRSRRRDHRLARGVVPDDRIALAGNMFSALFGHFPNLVTMRGDRMRSALAFVESVQRVIDLEPELLLLGHHGPVRGARPSARVRADPRRRAIGARRDVAAMNDGRDVWTAMHDIQLPELSTWARRTAASTGACGRSGRRTRAGSTNTRHSTSTARPPEHGAQEIVDLAGGIDAVAQRAAALVRDRRPRRDPPVRARARRRRPAPRRARRVPPRPRTAAERARPRELLAHPLARRRGAQRDEPARASRRRQ